MRGTRGKLPMDDLSSYSMNCLHPRHLDSNCLHPRHLDSNCRRRDFSAGASLKSSFSSSSRFGSLRNLGHGSGPDFSDDRLRQWVRYADRLSMFARIRVNRIGIGIFVDIFLIQDQD